MGYYIYITLLALTVLCDIAVVIGCTRIMMLCSAGIRENNEQIERIRKLRAKEE